MSDVGMVMNVTNDVGSYRERTHVLATSDASSAHEIGKALQLRVASVQGQPNAEEFSRKLDVALGVVGAQASAGASQTFGPTDPSRMIRKGPLVDSTFG